MLAFPSHWARLASDLALDHRALATGSEAALLLAIAALWLLGVAIVIAFKLRSR